MNPNLGVVFPFLAIVMTSCSTLPVPKMVRYQFPEKAYIGIPDKLYDVLGLVRTKVNFLSLDPTHDDAALCKNYFNKAVIDLIKRSKEKKADAVIDIKSVVFLMDGRVETYPTPECSDDGQEGQILAQGLAVKWKPETSPQPEKAQ